MENQLTSTHPSPSRIGVRRLSATASLVAAMLFVISSVAAHVSQSNAFAGAWTFTFSGPESMPALIEGVLWSAVVGFGIGFLAAITYNALGALDKLPDIFTEDDEGSLATVVRDDLDTAWRDDKHIGVAEALRIVENREKHRTRPHPG